MDDRRQFVLAAAITTLTLVVLIGVFVAFYPEPDGRSKQEQVADARLQAPDIIEKPENGRAPEHPGDPGGSQQLILFGVLLAGMGTIAGLAWRGSRRAKARAGAGPGEPAPVRT